MDSNTKSGDKWEIIAIKYLIEIWYKIITTNYKVQGWEIDIVSEYNWNTIFLEVKFRKNNSYWSPEEGFTKNKRKNILRAIKYYMLKKFINEENVRFEFIWITDNNWKIGINHLKDVEL